MSSDFKIIDPRTISDYNQLLINSENYSVFQTTNWAEVLCESYNYKPLYIIKKNDISFDILLPIMLIKSFLTGKRLVSLPFSDFCEPIISNRYNQESERLIGKLIELGIEESVKYIEFNTSDNIISENIPRKIVFGHLLDLDKSEDKLMDDQRKDTRTNIAKAKKNGIIIKINNSESDLLQYFQLHCMTRKRLGIPPQPLSFFKSILKHLIEKDMGFITLAFKDNECIAGAIYLFLGNKAVYKFSASNERYRDLKPNNLIMWESILHCKKINLKLLHFGRTEEHHQGLRTYKRGWGVEEKIIKFYRYSIIQQNYIDCRSFNTQNYYKLFTMLPIPILKKIGNISYRHFG